MTEPIHSCQDPALAEALAHQGPSLVAISADALLM